MPASHGSDKVRENRLRRMADRQGLEIHKSRRRDPRAIDYDRWLILDARTNAVVAGTEGTPSARPDARRGRGVPDGRRVDPR